MMRQRLQLRDAVAAVGQGGYIGWVGRLSDPGSTDKDSITVFVVDEIREDVVVLSGVSGSEKDVDRRAYKLSREEYGWVKELPADIEMVSEVRCRRCDNVIGYSVVQLATSAISCPACMATVKYRLR